MNELPENGSYIDSGRGMALIRLLPHVRLAPELHQRLRVVVAAEDTSVQEWVARVIEKAVEEKWSNISN